MGILSRIIGTVTRYGHILAYDGNDTARHSLSRRTGIIVCVIRIQYMFIRLRGRVVIKGVGHLDHV